MKVSTCLRLASFLIALTPNVTTARPPSGAQPEVFTIGFQEKVTATQSGLRLHFSGYYDARCPADVVCIRAGEAFAFFWITGPDIETQILSLPSGESFPRSPSVRIGRYEFVLRSLEPRPMLKAPVSPIAYKAVVSVALAAGED
jgi:hypothetical protein